MDGPVVCFLNIVLFLFLKNFNSIFVSSENLFLYPYTVGKIVELKFYSPVAIVKLSINKEMLMLLIF